MPTFPPTTRVPKHPSHALAGGWVQDNDTSPPTVGVVLRCQYCDVASTDPKILEPCVPSPATKRGAQILAELAKETDWMGEEVPADEDDQKVITVWEVNPHPQRPGLVLWERSWQKMCAFVAGSLDNWLESIEPADLATGVAMTFKTILMTVAEYREAVADDGR